MPTLIEKPPVASSSSHLSADVVAVSHRWKRWRGVLIAGVVGLTATLVALWTLHLYGHAPLQWTLLAGIWLVGLAVTAIAAYIGWRLAPATLLNTAQQLDRDLTAKNRLEAAATLRESSSPLALAQREETETYLRSASAPVRPGRRAWSWLLAALVLLMVAHVITAGLWLLPSLFQPPKPVPPPPPKAFPKASIIWKSPTPETKANPIEEVPTVALAQSTTGLKNMTLEISVNGEPRKSTPLPAQPFDQAGKNTVKVSLYMDELKVEPFDVVSYYLHAQRITDLKVPDTTSAIQFVQVRPFRDDVQQMRGAEGGNPAYALLIRLKLAQLKAVKENFVLAHTDLPVTDPLRMKENDRVGKNQGDLSSKTEEVVQFFITKGVDATIVDLLRQAEEPMATASKKILANQNAAALPDQQKALSIIIEIEKYFHKVMADGKGKPSDNPNDPFKDKQKHELKKRMEMVAGQLETLARNQTKLGNDLGKSSGQEQNQSSPASSSPAPGQPSAGSPSPAGTPSGTPGSDAVGDGQKPIPLPPGQSVDPFGPDAGKGTYAERQARVVQGIATLLNGNTVLPPGVVDALQQAQKNATTSLQSLDQNDTSGARDPAAQAAQDLQKAIAEMNRLGDQETKQALDENQQKLNDLAHDLNDLAKNPGPDASDKLNDLAQKAGDIRRNLEDAADHQQEAGSAPGAQRLNKLAGAITDKKVEKDLAAMAKQGLDANKAAAVAATLEQLAGQAAQSAIPGKPTGQEIANIMNALERSRANLARLAQESVGTAPDEQHQDQGNGQKPGDQTGSTPGQEPKGGQGQKPGQGQAPGEGKDPGKGQGKGQDQGKGQGQGQDQGKGQGKDPGKGQGQNQGKGEGQGQGQGDGQGQSPTGNQPSDPNKTPEKSQGQGGDSPGGQGSGGQADPNQATESNGSGGGRAGGGNGPAMPDKQDMSNPPRNSGQTSEQTAQAYREVIQDLRTQAQQLQAIDVIAPKAAPFNGIIKNDIDTHYREVTPVNIIKGYDAIAGPLDQLIFDLQQALAHAQREEVVKQPDLDEAPAAYRPAVNDYFETMSKNYHPDSGDADPKKKP